MTSKHLYCRVVLSTVNDWALVIFGDGGAGVLSYGEGVFLVKTPFSCGGVGGRPVDESW